MIETADNDFFGNVEEETQRRLKEMENEEQMAKTSIKDSNSQEHIEDNEIKPNEDGNVDLQMSVDDIKKEVNKESEDDQ